MNYLSLDRLTDLQSELLSNFNLQNTRTRVGLGGGLVVLAAAVACVVHKILDRLLGVPKESEVFTVRKIAHVTVAFAFLAVQVYGVAIAVFGPQLV